MNLDMRTISFLIGGAFFVAAALMLITGRRAR